MRDRHRPIASLPTMLCTLFVCLSLCVSFVWTYTPGNCTLEVGKNVIYWSNDTQVPEGKTVVNGTQIRVTCPKTGSDYDYDTTGEKVSEADIECIDGNFTDHGLVCENETKSSPETLPSPSKCTTIANGNITDRGKSFVCNQDFQPAFKNGMDAVLYTRYSCTCNQSSGRLQCMGTEVECKPIGCKIPANIQQGMELYDPRERRKISAANRYEIQHGYVLIFTCEPSDVFYFEPNQRMFECVKGSWVAKIRGGGTWDLGNNGSFPECRKVVCPADYCKFGGHCIRDHECVCPKQTSGKQCETPLCSPECQNQGKCVLPDTCQCPGGFDGLRCENDVNECAPAPCKNGATCNNLQNAYSCRCTPGWKGNDCDQDINECVSAPCENSATCNNLENAYTCTCVPGWQGKNCDQDIDECASNPCKNGATCTNLQNKYSCKCKTGWKGNDCVQARCNPECKNGGQCVSPDRCQCPKGYNGTRCENETCNALMAPTNGYVSSGNNTAAFTCDDPYCLDRYKTPVCNQGQWNGTNSVCLKGSRVCSTADYLVKNSPLSVSSQYNPDVPEMFGAEQGRLNSREKGQGTGIKAGVWAAGLENKMQYIQVSFSAPKIITAIETRGRPTSPNQEHPQWVTQYLFLYSKDCVTFNIYTDENGAPKIFPANTNGTSTVTRKLPCPVLAMCARLNPISWHDYISMAFDIWGCDGSSFKEF